MISSVFKLLFMILMLVIVLKSSVHSFPWLSSGRSVSGGPLQIGSMTGQEYQQDTVSSSNLAIILHPSSLQYHHSHNPPLHMQGMQGVGYNFHPQLPAPSYRNPTNCISHQCTMISSRDGPGYASWYQRSFTSGGDRIYRPNQRVSQSASDDLNR